MIVFLYHVNITQPVFKIIETQSQAIEAWPGIYELQNPKFGLVYLHQESIEKLFVREPYLLYYTLEENLPVAMNSILAKKYLEARRKANWHTSTASM